MCNKQEERNKKVFFFILLLLHFLNGEIFWFTRGSEMQRSDLSFQSGLSGLHPHFFFFL